ncbi:acyl-CoA Delta(11) desaturase isoform X2 [Tribolium castaneum]|uniref:acyl-CoA Delta(11) desaturase isoform X2 n=1 Tax=Tribolium castaneum TaxID=7070 RepID=UPI0030FEA579
MAPNSTVTTTLTASELSPRESKILPEVTYRTLWGNFKTPLIWPNIIGIISVHVITIIGFVTFPYFQHKSTFAWCNFLAIVDLVQCVFIVPIFLGFVTGWAGGFGVTAGAHRLWTHKSYKNRLREWVRDHRVHHKFSESDADPHNANRGFFFAHVGWLMMRKHPEVLRKGKSIDCSDLFEDSVVVFFEKFFWPMKLFWCFIFPTMIPYFCWNETFYWCVMSCIARYVCGLNFTWLVNSAAHMFGNKPYDRKIQPVENLMVSILAMGEGWHNYHHTFPWDYKAAELGNYKVNATTLLLDLFAKIGWAYDLKSPSKQLIQQVIENHGDGTRRD